MSDATKPDPIQEQDRENLRVVESALALLPALADDVEVLRRELQQARETNRKLNRRCQELESATSDFRWMLEHGQRTGQGYEGIAAGRQVLEQWRAYRARYGCLECGAKQGAEHGPNCSEKNGR